jgi:hypothetical protein
MFTISFEMVYAKKYNSLVTKGWVSLEEKALFNYSICATIDSININWRL